MSGSGAHIADPEVPHAQRIRSLLPSYTVLPGLYHVQDEHNPDVSDFREDDFLGQHRHGIRRKGESTALVGQPNTRRRLNLLGLFLNTFVPWGLFCGAYAALSFSLHYDRPVLAWILVGAILALGVAMFVWGWEASKAEGGARRPKWWFFLGGMVFWSTLVAFLVGDMNFWFNMQPYYDLRTLGVYPSLNPARVSGQEVMDAGRVYFSEGSRVDTTMSMGFRNGNIYCVAPIVNGDGMKVFDFWAVGINCCNGLSPDFRCGEWQIARARSGIRMIEDDLRPWYRLAVDQAESAHGITAKHPIFFEWVLDPVQHMNAYKFEGYKWYLIGVFIHLAVSFFLASCVGLFSWQDAVIASRKERDHAKPRMESLRK